MTRDIVKIIDEILLQWAICDRKEIKERLQQREVIRDWIVARDIPVIIRDDLEAMISYLEATNSFPQETKRIRSWIRVIDSTQSLSESDRCV